MKQSDFLSQFIGSVVRARLVRIFLFNPLETFTGDILTSRTGVTRALLTKEIKQLEEMKMVKSVFVSVRTKKTVKKQRGWHLNPRFEYAMALTSFVNAVSPAQYDMIEHALSKAGKVATIILSGVFMNDPARPVDILLAVDELNRKSLENGLRNLEQLFGREIRYAAFPVSEFRYRLTIQDRLLRDTLDFPHSTLLDKVGLVV